MVHTRDANRTRPFARRRVHQKAKAFITPLVVAIAVTLLVWKFEDTIVNAPVPLSGGLFGEPYPAQPQAHPNAYLLALAVLIGLASGCILLFARRRRLRC